MCVETLTGVLFWFSDLLGKPFRAVRFPFETLSGSLLLLLLQIPQVAATALGIDPFILEKGMCSRTGGYWILAATGLLRPRLSEVSTLRGDGGNVPRLCVCTEVLKALKARRTAGAASVQPSVQPPCQPLQPLRS